MSEFDEDVNDGVPNIDEAADEEVAEDEVEEGDENEI